METLTFVQFSGWLANIVCFCHTLVAQLQFDLVWFYYVYLYFSRDFTCNLLIFQEQLLSISRLFTVAKFSLDLECSVSVRKRLIPFLKKCQAAYQLPFFVTWVVSLVGLQFTSSNKRNVFLYLLEWLTFVRDGKWISFTTSVISRRLWRGKEVAYAINTLKLFDFNFNITIENVMFV